MPQCIYLSDRKLTTLLSCRVNFSGAGTKMRTPVHSIWKWESIWWLAFPNIQRSHLTIEGINLKHGNFLMQSRPQLHNSFSHEFTDKKKNHATISKTPIAAKLKETPAVRNSISYSLLPVSFFWKEDTTEINYVYFARWNRVQGKALKRYRLCIIHYVSGPAISEKKPDILG